MKSTRRVRMAILSLVLAGTCLTSVVRAADANSLPAPQIADVALRDGGTLVGQMVDGQNIPKTNIRVALQDAQNHEVAAATTNQQGYFTMSGLRSGVYQVVTPQGRQVYRLWQPGMAPPSAQSGILLVADGNTVRGVAGNGTLKTLLTNPLVIGGVVATAVAVPVALSNNHHPASP